MSINSRTKGKRGELELAAELSRITGRQWRRAQQRKGTATADVECDGTRLHVECKRVRAGLARLLPILDRVPVHAACVLGNRPAWLFPMASPPESSRGEQIRPTCVPAIFGKALAQAERDAAPECIPLVCVRQDRGAWIACCRPWHIDLVRAELTPTIHAGPPAPLSGERAHGCAAGSGVA